MFFRTLSFRAKVSVLAICSLAVTAALVETAPAQQPATPDTTQQQAQPTSPPQDTTTAPAPNQTPDAVQQPPAPAPDTQTAPQQPAPDTAPGLAPPAPTTPASEPRAPAAAEPATPAPTQQSTALDASQPGAITEEELRRLLVGKSLYLRGGYLENSLSFSEHGDIIGHPPQASYTLSGVQIEKVHLTKHKVELEGARYGLHFLGALPTEDATAAVDRVKITPKKKVLKITIDRELVVTPKKKKEKEKGKRPQPMPAKPGQPAPALQPGEIKETSEADDAKAEIAAAPAAERPADPTSVTTTLSPAHASQVLRDAIDRIFATGLDDKLLAVMPDFWKLYYQAVAAKSDYRPKDPTVLRQNAVDQKAKLLSTFEPASNEYAQNNGVAGMALYHTVIGADGKPGEIAVGRPIGFGLDENAVEAIRKASFQPAMKDGKPVPVMLDLVVQFRIYSKRTAVNGKSDKDEQGEPVRPGPYSIQHP